MSFLLRPFLYLLGLGAISFCAIGFAFSFKSLERHNELLGTESRILIWLTTQAELELFRFNNALHLFVEGEGEVDKAELLKRFDIFWSRIPLLTQGEEGAMITKIPGTQTLADKIIDNLAHIEPQVLNLERGELQAASPLYRVLAEFAEELHQLSVKTLQLRRDIATQRIADGRKLRQSMLLHMFGMVGGALLIVSLFFWQLSARLKAQRTLREVLENVEAERDRMEAVVHAVSDGLVVTDSFGKVHLLNRAAQHFVGLTDLQAQGRKVTELFPAEGFQRFWQQVSAENLPEKPLELRFWGDETAPRELEIRAFYVRHAGVVQGMVLALRDLTLEKSVDRLKSEFVATAAHELRTPLTGIVGYAELLLNSPEAVRPEGRKYLQYILDRSWSLTQVVDELLDLERINSGRKLMLKRQRVDLLPLVQQYLGVYRERHPAHSIELEVSGTKRQAEVDPVKFGQMVENILSNAVKYSPEGGAIRVRLDFDAEAVSLRVADEGVGMDEEVQTRVFDKFYRDASVADSISGTGLGMSIVKDLTEAHGGSVKLSSARGKGTEVTLHLPC